MKWTWEKLMIKKVSIWTVGGGTNCKLEVETNLGNSHSPWFLAGRTPDYGYWRKANEQNLRMDGLAQVTFVFSDFSVLAHANCIVLASCSTS